MEVLIVSSAIQGHTATAYLVDPDNKTSVFLIKMYFTLKLVFHSTYIVYSRI